MLGSAWMEGRDVVIYTTEDGVRSLVKETRRDDNVAVLANTIHSGSTDRVLMGKHGALMGEHGAGESS